MLEGLFCHLSKELVRDDGEVDIKNKYFGKPKLRSNQSI